jgi:hypothetical protein
MRLPVAALALLSAGCLTTEMRSVASTPAPEVRVGARARMWEVRSGGELVGLVVLFQEHGARATRSTSCAIRGTRTSG